MDDATASFISQMSHGSTKDVTCASGCYRVWRSSAGAEVWLHYPRTPKPAAGAAARTSGQHPIEDLKGLGVFHRGASDIRMRLAKSIAISGRNPLDGVCVGTLPVLTPGKDAAGKSAAKPINFIFEHINFGNDAIVSTVMARVQVTGLAQKVWAFPTEADYLANVASNRMIARGAMAEVDAKDIPDVAMIYRPKPGALWLATGIVKRSIRLTNPVTNNPYAWLLLATERGDIDIVANPSVIDGDISVGHTVQAVVTMAGRIIERLAA